MEMWFWPLAVLALVAAVATLVWLDIGQSTRGRVTRHFVCPEVKRDVVVTFRSDFLDPHYFEDVARCSEFGSGEAVACDRLCLGLSKNELDRAERLTRGVGEPVTG